MRFELTHKLGPGRVRSLTLPRRCSHCRLVTAGYLGEIAVDLLIDVRSKSRVAHCSLPAISTSSARTRPK